METHELEHESAIYHAVMVYHEEEWAKFMVEMWKLPAYFSEEYRLRDEGLLWAK